MAVIAHRDRSSVYVYRDPRKGKLDIVGIDARGLDL